MSHFNRGRAAAAALLTFALCALAPAAAHAQDPAPAEQAPPQGFVVDTVVVRGTQRVTEEAVRTSAGIRSGSVVNAQLVQESIRRLMGTGNFESVQVYVRGAEQGRGALVLDVRERPFVAQIQFVGLRSVSGGTEQTRYYVSGLVKNDEGVVLNTGYEKQSLRINLQQTTVCHYAHVVAVGGLADVLRRLFPQEADTAA